MGGGNGGGPCVLYFTLAVDHRLAGRPASLRGLRPLQQPPSSGRLGARSALQTALLPLPSSLPSSESFSFWPLCKSSAMLVRFVWPLFLPEEHSEWSPRFLPLSCLHSHTFTLTLSLSLSHRRRVEKKNCSLLLSSSRALSPSSSAQPLPPGSFTPLGE